MRNFFYKLGRKAGPKFRKAKWVYKSLTGSEEEIVQMEQQAGKDIAIEFRRQAAIDTDSETVKMLDEIGGRLADCVKNKQLRFHFQSITGHAPNAFALPGGYIFISRSLLELSQWNKDEIAATLAHEMGHVVHRHAMDRMIAASAISMGAKSFKVGGALANWLKTAGIKSLQSAYSQDQEADADDFAVRLTYAAGYDPKGCLRLFDRLALLKDESKDNILSEYFSTHPSFEQRSVNVKESLSRLK